MPLLSWNLQMKVSSPLSGNVTSASASSPGWTSWSTLCSAIGEGVSLLTLVLELDRHLLAGRALEHGGLEVVVVHLDLHLARLAGDVLGPVSLGRDAADRHRRPFAFLALLVVAVPAARRHREQQYERGGEQWNSSHECHRVDLTQCASDRFSDPFRPRARRPRGPRRARSRAPAAAGGARHAADHLVARTRISSPAAAASTSSTRSPRLTLPR